MQIGDLVKFVGRPSNWEHPCGVGIVVYASRYHKFEQTCDVLWTDGRTTHHHSRWLAQIQEKICK